MASEDYRKASYGIWQAMAAGWDRQRSWMWRSLAWDVGGLARGLRADARGAQPQPGQRAPFERAMADFRANGGLQLPGVALDARRTEREAVGRSGDRLAAALLERGGCRGHGRASEWTVPMISAFSMPGR